jgi:hypothetical protein
VSFSAGGRFIFNVKKGGVQNRQNLFFRHLFERYTANSFRIAPPDHHSQVLPLGAITLTASARQGDTDAMRPTQKWSLHRREHSSAE